MAVSYREMKCKGCGSTSFLYHKDRKTWECKYCGNEIQRQEEYDGLYTIKNIVRQVVENVAYDRIDEAQKNLLECEKINAGYAGTIIAALAVDVFRMTSGILEPGEQKTAMARVKRRYQALKNLAPDVSSDEEAVYDAFEESGDAFGVLLLVYDTLNLEVHKSFVEQLLQLDKVYSVQLNTKLLRYAIHNKRFEMADQIFANVDNIDQRQALFVLLDAFPDGQEKRTHMQALFPKAAISPDDRTRFEAYLEKTEDCLETKAAVYQLSAARQAAPSVRVMIPQLLEAPETTQTSVQAILQCFCDTHPKDAELYEVVSLAYTVHNGATALAEMETLTDSGLFMKIPVKQVEAMLERKELAAEDRVRLLCYAEYGKYSERENDELLRDILLNVQDTPEIRLQLVEAMCGYVRTISTATMNNYVIQCTLDGDKKPDVVRILLNLELNMSYFRELLSQYMRYGSDHEPVKKEVAELLSGHGLQVDGATLLEMICTAEPGKQTELIAAVQSAINSGTRLGAQALDTYLIRRTPQEWDSSMISILHTSGSVISDQALIRYVLYAADLMDVKIDHCRVFAEQNGKPFGTVLCEITFDGSRIQCNLLQAYLFLTRDSETTVRMLVREMKNAGTKFQAPIRVAGQQIKYKKYLLEHQNILGENARKICDEQKLLTKGFF